MVVSNNKRLAVSSDVHARIKLALINSEFSSVDDYLRNLLGMPKK